LRPRGAGKIRFCDKALGRQRRHITAAEAGALSKRAHPSAIGKRGAGKLLLV